MSHTIAKVRKIYFSFTTLNLKITNYMKRNKLLNTSRLDKHFD